jgi:hypothetical protein
MAVALRTSGTLVNVYQFTLRYNPEDSHLRFYKLTDEFVLQGKVRVKRYVAKHKVFSLT